MPIVPRPMLLLLAALLSACAYPNHASGVAPSYPSGYQPVMDGQGGGWASDWPEQPGALWGPEDVPSIDVFREPLSPYGRWLQSPQWGLVFVPAVQRDWRPYQNGQWLENRFWLSADPWGWATDHYGRWGFDEAVGWVWVPDVTWGPSWVAWREADEVVGWAPIPPRVVWNVGFGFGSGFGHDNWNSWYGPSWVWVPRASLYARGFGGRIYPWNSGPGWWGRSRWQHAPYWGWNRPWDRSWGWRAPGYGRGYAGPNWGGQNWGDRNWNNRRGGYDPRWNDNRGWRGNQGRDWDRDRYRDRSIGEPRRGQPGSVGDRIGRDLGGQPGWNGSNRGWDQNRGRNWRQSEGKDGTGGPRRWQATPNQGQAQPGAGWQGDGRGQWRGGRGGQPGAQPGGQPGGQPRMAPPARVADAVGGGMAPPSMPPPMERRTERAERRGGDDSGQRPNWQPRSEPRAERRSEARGDFGQRSGNWRSNGESNEQPR